MPNLAKLSKYLKSDSVAEGDIIEFKDAGQLIDQNFNGEERTVFQVTVMINGEKKVYSPNGTTRGILGKAWGNDTEKWVGKKARLSFAEKNGREILIAKPVTTTKEEEESDPDEV